MYYFNGATVFLWYIIAPKVLNSSKDTENTNSVQLFVPIKLVQIALNALKWFADKFDKSLWSI